MDRSLSASGLAPNDATQGLVSLAGTARPGFETVHSAHADLAHLNHDRELTEKIMKKRQEEMQRRTKLLDPRKRQFGVDHAVLDAQLLEKRQVHDAEVEEEMRHAEAGLLQDQVLQHLEGIKQVATRERQKAANDFSLANLRMEQRREYALSDPHALKKDRPIDVDDERLGPSSFQRFEGQADADPSIRKRMQQRNMREFLEQQMREKQDRQQAERELELQYDRDAIAACQVRSYCEHAEREERRQDKLEEAAHNKELAQIHANRRQARAQRDAMEKDRHVEHVMRSQGEGANWKMGSNGKLLASEYRGLSLDEEQDAYDTRARQVLERQARRRAELADEAEHTRATGVAVGVLSALEGERARQQKERTMKMVADNKALEDAKHRADHDERRKYRSWEHEP